MANEKTKTGISRFVPAFFKKEKAETKKTKTEERSYEGASKKKRLRSWYASNRSAISEISKDLITLRNRSRDLRRNNPYAAKGVSAVSSNVVGTGIKTQFRESETNVLTDGPFETRWKAWAHSKEIDFDGHHNIFGLQRLIIEAIVESGEVLVRKRIDASLDMPIQYQVLEPDFLDTNLSNKKLANGNTIVQGIEFDQQGKRVAYHIRETHPGGIDSLGFASKVKSNRIDAADIYHLFRMDRPGQARGVPWCSPVIVRLKDLDDYEDAQIVRQKIAACFTAFIRDINGDMTDEGEEECDLPERVEPGIIEELPPGKTVEFVSPPSVEGFGEFTSTLLHAIAAGYGITYEELTGDLSGVNFSSGRMGWLAFYRNIKMWRDDLMISQFLNEVVEDFTQTLSIMGVRSNTLKVVHTPPKREMIDPTKEIPAIVQGIRAGITSLSEEIRAQGRDPIDHLDEFKKDLELLDELGIVLDVDPRRIGLNGNAQQTETDNEGEINE